MNKKIFENEYMLVSEDSLLALAVTLKSGVFNNSGAAEVAVFGRQEMLRLAKALIDYCEETR